MKKANSVDNRLDVDESDDSVSLHLFKLSQICLFVCFLARQTPPPVGHGLLIHEVSRLHTTTHHSR
jgi:hypothetical protein